MDYLEKARWVIEREIEGLQAILHQLDDSFVELVQRSLACLEKGGKLILSGVGKSGYIGHKIAATLASTGSPAAFLHPVEAMHGDLGIICMNDILICLSYSGETDELLQILPAVRRFDIPIVAITSDPSSSLAEFSDLVIKLKVPSEACPFNLAPTTSSTATLAFGDALAIVLMQARKFTRHDYSRLHPAGAIGRAITLKVKDIMRPLDKIPTAHENIPIREAIMAMTRARSGSVIITDTDGRLKGIFTDGDFRRAMNECPNGNDILDREIAHFMTQNPIHVTDEAMAIDAIRIFEKHKIDDLPVTDAQGMACGLIDIQDLPKVKLM